MYIKYNCKDIPAQNIKVKMVKKQSYNSKVSHIDEWKQDFQNTQSATLQELCPGFSDRLNFLIDFTDLDIPSMDKGRISAISEICEVSMPAASDWLKKNRPPRDAVKDKSKDIATLHKLVVFLLKHINSTVKPNTTRVMAWLRYGESAVGDPFEIAITTENTASLLPLATTLILEAARNTDVEISSIDLDPLMTAVIETLQGFAISDIANIQNIHKKIIQAQLELHNKA